MVERGTWTELMGKEGEEAEFRRMMEAFTDEEKDNGSDNGRGANEVSEDTEGTASPEKRKSASAVAAPAQTMTITGAGTGIMQAEERKTGNVAGSVYLEYFRSAKGYVTIPVLLVALVVYEGCTVMSSYWYVPFCSFSFLSSHVDF